MTTRQDLLPPHLRDRIQAAVESRLQTVADLANRRLPLVPTYRVGTAEDLANHLLMVLHTLSDQEKRDLMRMLELTISDIDRASGD